MTYGPRVASAAAAQDRDTARRRRVTDIVEHAVTRSRRAIVLTIAVSVAYGVAVAGLAAVLDLPAPSALGFSVGVLSLLPHVGVVLGATPPLLLAVGREPANIAVAVVLLILPLQLHVSPLIRPFVTPRSL